MNLRKIDNFFFDLDGTLLGISDKSFAQEFPVRMYDSFKDLLDFEPFINALNISYDALYKHTNPNELLAPVYVNHFSKLTGLDYDIIWERVLLFYSTTFLEMEKFMEPVAGVRELLDELHNRDKTIVLATNPVFPEISTRARCSWAGVDYDEFRFVSHIENSTSCKPNHQYYDWILQKVNALPENSMMIGNDYLYDMSASNVNMSTWMTDRYQSHLEYKGKYAVNYEGSLLDLLNKLED